MFSPFSFGLRAMVRVNEVRDLVYDECQSRAAAPSTLCSQPLQTFEIEES